MYEKELKHLSKELVHLGKEYEEIKKELTKFSSDKEAIEKNVNRCWSIYSRISACSTGEK